MTVKKDYYQVLSVPKDATLAQIRKAYRELILQSHPDRVPPARKKEAEEKFKEISEAYAVLSDPKKKALYDRQGHSGIDAKYSYDDLFKGTDFRKVFEGFGFHFFDDLLGGFGFSPFHQTKHSEVIDLEISLEEAAFGCEKTLFLSSQAPCSTCQGSGTRPGTFKTPCSTCQGSGFLSSKQGSMRLMQTCPSCQGQGMLISSPCSSCQGTGHQTDKTPLHLQIPPGVDNGHIITKDNLSFAIRIQRHPLFERKGSDLVTHTTLPLSKALLGGEIEVETLFGKVLMTIPEGTQPGKIFRLKGKGLSLKGVHGDEFVVIHIQIPSSLSPQEKLAIENLAKNHPGF